MVRIHRRKDKNVRTVRVFGKKRKDVKDEAKSVQDLSEVLSKIITTYEDSEASLVAKKDTVDQNKVPGENAQDEKQNQKVI